MKIAALSIRRPVGTVLFILAIAVLGFVSIPTIPVAFWPEFVAPTIVVIAPYPGVGPEEVEEQIAKPLEEELSTIDGLEEIETTCMEGVCQMYVRFGWGIDFEEVKLTVQDRTNKARARFPRGAPEPQVLQVQDFLPPGIEIGFFSDRMSLNEIRDYVKSRLVNRFLRLENVATVQLTGGYEQQVTVRLDPERLRAFRLNPSQVVSVLAAENRNVPAGKIETERNNFFIRTIGRFESLDELEQLVVGTVGRRPVLLRDVATVTLENKERETVTRLNGRELIGLAIREKSGGNTVAMCDEVKEELERIKAELPPDLNVTIIRDQSTFIKRSIQNVLRNAFIGACLAGIIILLFLGNIRNTLIVALSIPISVVATLVLVDKFGLTINTISLGGLALGVGMIVDSSIVVIENIFRHLSERPGDDRFQTVVEATGEVGNAVIASTLTSIVVFLPMAFLVGLAATLLGELALTVVFALSISMVVALTVVPMLSFKLMRVRGGTGNWFVRTWQRGFDRLLQVYRATIAWALRHRFLTLLIAFVLLVVMVGGLARFIDVELLPAINEGEFQVEITLSEGTKLERTDAVTRRIEQDLLQMTEIQQAYSVVGLYSARGELKPNYSIITVDLKPEYVASLQPVMEGLRTRWDDIPGAKIVVRQVDVTAGMRREPINVRIMGDDLRTLTLLGDEALKTIQAIPGAVNVTSTMEAGVREFALRIDRAKAADLGVSAGQIAGTVQLAILGTDASRYTVGGDELDIHVQVDERRLQSVQDILDLPIRTLKGHVVPLRTVASYRLERSPQMIKRFDQQRAVEIKGDVMGRSQREVVAEVRRQMAQLRLPEGYYVTYGGQSKAITDSFRSLGIALVIAIFLVYVVMGTQFNSYIHPFTIALSIPLALIGVVLGLLIFGANFSMNAFLGIIMLVGIVVNNGILLIDYIGQLRERGLPMNEAIIEGGSRRLRPVLITSLTTIFGMLPIALGLGQGGEALKPLGAVVVGGLATSTMLTLIVVPVVYSLLDRFTKRKGL